MPQLETLPIELSTLQESIETFQQDIETFFTEVQRQKDLCKDYAHSPTRLQSVYNRFGIMQGFISVIQENLKNLSNETIIINNLDKYGKEVI